MKGVRIKGDSNILRYDSTKLGKFKAVHVKENGYHIQDTKMNAN